MARGKSKAGGGVEPAVAPQPAGVVEQAAALVRVGRGAAALVLLITSRGTGRWVLPKGWIGKGSARGKGARGTAAIEAWEEGGVRGKVLSPPLGTYLASKERPGAAAADKTPCATCVFLLEAEEIAGVWPESSQRDRVWVPPEAAAQLVEEPDLAALITAAGAAWAVTRRIQSLGDRAGKRQKTARTRLVENERVKRGKDSG